MAPAAPESTSRRSVPPVSAPAPENTESSPESSKATEADSVLEACAEPVPIAHQVPAATPVYDHGYDHISEEAFTEIIPLTHQGAPFDIGQDQMVTSPAQ